MTTIDNGHIRLERLKDSKIDSVAHIAGGQHSGIIIRKECPEGYDNQRGVSDVSLEFTVFLVNMEESGLRFQERRKLMFWFASEMPTEKRFQVAQEFFKELLNGEDFPRDYVGFIKRLLKLVQMGYEQLLQLDCIMKQVEAPAVLPPSKETYEGNIWDRHLQGQAVDANIVQEVLEHAYPSAITVQSVSKMLNCSDAEIFVLLRDLESRNLAVKHDQDHWVRSAHQLEQIAAKDVKPVGGPTIAIITSLFVEKLVVDSMIGNRQTYVRYKTDGESNVYTVGEINGHQVVATKLSAVGHTRQAMTAAGSITTRLLGGFQTIEHVFIVGVGGGVPHYTDASRHVRLGDVVVSSSKTNSYVYCDRVERNSNTDAVEGYAVKTWRHSDSSEFESLQAAITQIQTDALEAQHCPVWSEAVSRSLPELQSASADFSFSRPPGDSDKLYMWVGGTDVVQVSHPDERNYSRLHFGPIGTGRAVTCDASVRSDFAEQFSVLAFDAEFDSVVESVFGNRINSWALIRGISDYVDGQSGKEWQPYAALQAAAFTKCLLGRLKKSS